MIVTVQQLLEGGEVCEFQLYELYPGQRIALLITHHSSCLQRLEVIGAQIRLSNFSA
jgi:hypothetical protein